MAGIGFELRKMIDDRGDLVSRIKGYVSAGLISAGPWIMTVITIGGIDLLVRGSATPEDYELFRGLVTYAFAFSLIVVGAIQMAVTRKVADLLYTRDHDAVLPAMVSCMAVLGVIQLLIGATFCWTVDLDLVTSIGAVSLYVVVSLTWIALIWLGVTKDYDAVLRAFAVGSAVSIAGTWWVRDALGGGALLLAYGLGQSVTLVMLLSALVRGMDASGKRSLDVFASVPKYPQLVFVGLAYNTAIWADKMIFWFADGVGPHTGVRFHPLYDSCCFLAYLTVVPALAINLVRVETSFYERYREYYGAILDGLPLREIEEARGRMSHELSDAAIRLLRIQGAITLAFIVFAGPLLAALGIPEAGVPVFRACCLGALFHVFLLVTLLLLLYFDLRRRAALAALCFLGTNATFAAVSVRLGLWSYGLGYALAGLLSLVPALWMLARGLERLEYVTFASQTLDTTGRLGREELEAEEALEPVPA